MYSDLFSSLDGNFSFKIWAIPPLVSIYFFYQKSYIFRVDGCGINALTTLWYRSSNLNLTQQLLTNIIFTVIVLNLIGLIPYVYGVTTNIIFNLRLALLVWGAALRSGVGSNFISAIAHLVPSGSPLLLVPVLILIESIRIFIRPITLTVRLVANIRAGHIVISLLSNVLCRVSFNYSYLLTFSLSVGYIMFEIFVRLIQAYIFTLLIRLYIKEHPSV